MNAKSIRNFHHWFEVLTTTKRSQVAMMQLDPGQATGDKAESHDDADQVLLVIEGELEGEIGGKSITLQKEEFIVVEAGTKHRFVNHGKAPALTFNVYAPPEYPPDTKE